VRPIEIDQIEAIIPPDGSTVREIVRPGCGGAGGQSIAQATVAVGQETTEHLHRTSEEVYLFISGSGRMRLGDEEFGVQGGEAVVIAAGVRHKLWNTGVDPLVIFCCCSPPYRDEDTELLE
jgi:mannose-6-phosphate isomerase-like protein (cupin superfamily)